MLENKKVLVMAEIAILTALAVGLDFLAGIFFSLPQGGSISIAMVPIMLISFRRGVIAGVMTGFLVGMIQLMYGGHILQFFQFILDYPAAFAVVGFAGIFAKLTQKMNVYTIIAGSILGGLLRYLSHFLAGIIFWGEYTPVGKNLYAYSIVYNGIYMGPSIALSAILMGILYVIAKNLFEGDLKQGSMQIDEE